MRILLITDFYWPFLGGVEQHVRRLGQGMAARGHSVAVATLWQKGLKDFELDGQVRIYRLRSAVQQVPWLFKNPERPWAPPFPDPKISKALGQIIEKERPQVVHGHDWLARSFLPYKAKSGARFVMSLHYYTLSCAKKSLIRRGVPCNGPGVLKCLRCAAQHYGGGKGSVVALGNWKMSRVERSAVDMFLPVSHAVARGNQLDDRSLYQVIPNFMPGEGQSVSDISSYLTHLPEEDFLLFVGDLRRDKGIHVLLSAYAGLGNAPPLVLIGKVWRDTPKEYPPGVVVLKNWPNEAVLAAWKRSLLGIVPSLWPEPFGIVVIEAMESGRPVVASRVGGIPEIVIDGETGLLVPPGNVEELRNAIERLLSYPELRLKMGRSAQIKAEEYSALSVLPRIEQVYLNVLKMGAGQLREPRRHFGEMQP